MLFTRIGVWLFMCTELRRPRCVKLDPDSFLHGATPVCANSMNIFSNYPRYSSCSSILLFLLRCRPPFHLPKIRGISAEIWCKELCSWCSVKLDSMGRWEGDVGMRIGEGIRRGGLMGGVGEEMAVAGRDDRGAGREEIEFG